MPLVIVFSESSDRLRRSRPRAPRTPCSRALPRNAAMGRRRKDPSSSANVEAAKRGDGDTSYCLVRAPRGGSSEVFRRPHPCDTLLAHASRSGLPTRAPHVRNRDPTRPHTHARRHHHPETWGCRRSPVRVARLLRPRTPGEREGFAALEFLSERKRSDRDLVRSRRRPRGALAFGFRERDVARTASGDVIPRSRWPERTTTRTTDDCSSLGADALSPNGTQKNRAVSARA